MRFLVASTSDEASVNQRDAIVRAAPWEESDTFAGSPAWRRGDFILVTIPEHHLYRDDLDKDLANRFGVPELVVYLSKHRSESRTPSLTVHPLGNPHGADLGGRPGAFVTAAPSWMTAALRALRREARGLPYAVTFEATHHGPYLEAPTFYIEQGSTKREWNDPRASAAIARALLDLEALDAPVAIGLGGGHYVPRHTDLALERRIAFGHLLATYVLERGTEDVLARAVAKTPRATLAYLHRKSLSKPAARIWERRAEALGLRVVRETDLEVLPEAKGS